MTASPPEGILLVCRANECRSPLAASTLELAFASTPALETLRVESAGTEAHAGGSICRQVASMRDDEPWRRVTERHRARRMDTAAIERATLVLTASRRIRSEVASALPTRRHRVFTLREAVWLGEGFRADDGDDGDAVVEALLRHLDTQRGLRPLPQQRRLWLSRRTPQHPLDVRDGHVFGTRAHAKTLLQVEQASRRLAELLAGGRG